MTEWLYYRLGDDLNVSIEAACAAYLRRTGRVANLLQHRVDEPIVYPPLACEPEEGHYLLKGEVAVTNE